MGEAVSACFDLGILIVGTTCTGKSTFLKYIANAYDMDTLMFPQLTKESDIPSIMFPVG